MSETLGIEVSDIFLSEILVNTLKPIYIVCG